MAKGGIREMIASRDVEAFRAGIPQGKHIREADALAWMERQAQSTDFHEPGWHYNRLKGIGGSEASYAVQQGRILEGLAPDVPSRLPRGLFFEKLLRSSPEMANAAMLRGNRFEGMVIDRLLEQTGAKPRQDLMDAVASMSGKIGDHPWLVGNPDLIVETRKGRIALIDAKAPSQPASSVDPTYIAQLHHYRRLMLEAGVPPDMLMIGAFNWPEYRVDLLPVDFDGRLDGQLRQGGDHLWQAILDGKAPDHSVINWPKPTWEMLSESDQERRLEEIQAQEVAYLQAKMAADNALGEAREKADALAQSLTALGPVRGCKPKDYGMALAGVSATVKVDESRFIEVMRRLEKEKRVDEAYQTSKNFDVDRMAARLEEMGEDLEDYRARRLSSAKVIELLEQSGIPYAQQVGDVIEERPSIRLTPPKAGPRKEAFDELKATADAQWEQWQSLVGGEASLEEAPADPAVEMPPKAEPTSKVEPEANDSATTTTAAASSLFTTTFADSLNQLTSTEESLVSDSPGDMNPDSISPPRAVDQAAPSKVGEAETRSSASVLGLFGPG